MNARASGANGRGLICHKLGIEVSGTNGQGDDMPKLDKDEYRGFGYKWSMVDTMSLEGKQLLGPWVQRVKSQ